MAIEKTSEGVVYRARYIFDVELDSRDVQNLLLGDPKDIELNAGAIRLESVTVDEIESEPFGVLMTYPNTRIEELFQFVFCAAVRINRLRVASPFGLIAKGDRSRLIKILLTRFQSIMRSFSPPEWTRKARRWVAGRRDQELKSAYIVKLYGTLWEWVMSGETTKMSFLKLYYRLNDSDKYRSADSYYYRKFDAELKRNDVNQREFWGWARIWQLDYRSPILQDSPKLGADLEGEM